MRKWKALLGELGAVEAFDYPYMKEGRRAPDRLPRLVEAHRDALARARRRHPRARRVALAGKSMGARVGCHLALEEPVDALVCLGYPLRSPKGELRDAVLKALGTPVLFVQGTRDPLCPLDALARVRRAMKAPGALHAVESGNHSLEITKARAKAEGISQDDADRAALEAVRGFLGGI